MLPGKRVSGCHPEFSIKPVFSHLFLFCFVSVNLKTRADSQLFGHVLLSKYVIQRIWKVNRGKICFF